MRTRVQQVSISRPWPHYAPGFPVRSRRIIARVVRQPQRVPELMDHDLLASTVAQVFELANIDINEVGSTPMPPEGVIGPRRTIIVVAHFEIGYRARAVRSDIDATQGVPRFSRVAARSVVLRVTFEPNLTRRTCAIHRIVIQIMATRCPRRRSDCGQDTPAGDQRYCRPTSFHVWDDDTVALGGEEH